MAEPIGVNLFWTGESFSIRRFSCDGSQGNRTDDPFPSVEFKFSRLSGWASWVLSEDATPRRCWDPEQYEVRTIVHGDRVDIRAQESPKRKVFPFQQT